MKTITAFECKQCGHVMYPYHDRCLKCNGRQFKEIKPSAKGRLLTYTIVDQLPWGMDERGRVLGVVEFDNKVKALGVIKSDTPKIGMKLKAGWEPVRELGGQKVYGLTFEAAK